jgi:hypothetical protein
VFQIVVIMSRGKEDRKNPSAPFILFGQSPFQEVTKQTPLETFASEPNGPDFFMQLTMFNDKGFQNRSQLKTSVLLF